MAEPDHERAFLDALQSVGVKPGKADATPTAVVEDAENESPASASTAAESAPLGKVTAQNLWRHPDAHPIVLATKLLEKYGPEWLLWDPETLQVLIPQDFQTPTLSELNFSKIQACKVLQLMDSFWEAWEIFLWCSMPFNNEFPDFQVMQVPTVAQVLVAVDIANRIRDDVKWSSEVRTYIEQVYRHEGIFLPIPPADFITFVAPEEIDMAELTRRWPEYRKSQKPPTGQTPVDEQLRRLLIVNGFLEESRTRLHQQERLNA